MATISLAKKQNRLIFLSIGYNACHCVSQLFLSLLDYATWRTLLNQPVQESKH